MGHPSEAGADLPPEAETGLRPVGEAPPPARSRERRLALGVFLGLLALAEPPLLYLWANRIEPWILGMPFLFAYLLGVYLAMVGVLVWAMKRRL